MEEKGSEKGEKGSVLASCFIQPFNDFLHILAASRLCAVATDPAGIAHLQSPGNPKIRDNSPALDKGRERDFYGTPFWLAAEIANSQPLLAHLDQTLRLNFVMTSDLFVTWTRACGERIKLLQEPLPELL